MIVDCLRSVTMSPRNDMGKGHSFCSKEGEHNWSSGNEKKMGKWLLRRQLTISIIVTLTFFFKAGSIILRHLFLLLNVRICLSYFSQSPPGF